MNSNTRLNIQSFQCKSMASKIYVKCHKTLATMITSNFYGLSNVHNQHKLFYVNMSLTQLVKAFAAHKKVRNLNLYPTCWTPSKKKTKNKLKIKYTLYVMTMKKVEIKEVQSDTKVGLISHYNGSVIHSITRTYTRFILTKVWC